MFKSNKKTYGQKPDRLEECSKQACQHQYIVLEMQLTCVPFFWKTVSPYNFWKTVLPDSTTGDFL